MNDKKLDELSRRYKAGEIDDETYAAEVAKLPHEGTETAKNKVKKISRKLLSIKRLDICCL